MSTFTCRIELNKTEGLTISVDNEDGKILQVIKMNGTTIETTCKGEDETSTITQAPDSISMTCKSFSLNAETVEIKAKTSVTQSSDGTFSIKSEDALSLKTENTFTAESSSDFSAQGSSVNVKATSGAADVSAASSLSLKGQSATLEGQSEATVKGMNVSANGSVKVAVQGQMVSVSGTQVALG